MNKYFLLVLSFLFFLKANGQVGIGIYTGIIFAFRLSPDNWYSLSPGNFFTPFSGGSFTFNSAFPVSQMNRRSMYGVGAFLNNTDLYTQGQLSQKFMTFRQLELCNPNANTARIAWRYNVHNDKKYELGLYSHKNHTNPYSFCFQPKINSREVGYTDIRVSKSQLFNYQIIFGKYISAVRIWAQGNDQTVMIHRSSSNSTWPSFVTMTDAEAQLYASKDANIASNIFVMNAYSSAITVPIYFEVPYYHTNLLLLDCIFGSYENVTLSAKYSIVFPVKNYTGGSNNYQNTPPNPSYVPPYCIVQSGSKVNFKA